MATLVAVAAGSGAGKVDVGRRGKVIFGAKDDITDISRVRAHAFKP